MTLHPQSQVRMFYNDVIRLLRKLTYCWLKFLYYILFKRGINSRVCGSAWYWHWMSVLPVTLIKPFDLPACSFVNSAAPFMETNEFPGLCRSGHLGSKTDYSVIPSPLFYLGIFEHLFFRSSPLIWCPQMFIPVKVHLQLKYRDP